MNELTLRIAHRNKNLDLLAQGKNYEFFKYIKKYGGKGCPKS
jgi:hypothetical protein